MAGDEARCEFCGGELVLRTARSGRNAGQQFYGCEKWRPGQRHTTLDVAQLQRAGSPASEGVPVPQQRTGEPPETARRRFPRRVLWTDASTHRDGWLVRYLPAGAGLRCWPAAVHAALAPAVANSWMAVQDLPSYNPADPDTLRVLAMVQKLLHRGDAPPLPVDAEAALLQLAGVEAKPVAGTTTPVPRRPLDQGALLAASTWVRDEPVDPQLAVGSSEESALLTALAGQGHLPWTTAQPPLDQLTRGLGGDGEAHGTRRADFLITVPGAPPVVVEVDGEQHQTAQEVDRDRDAVLEAVGVTTHRVTAEQVRSGHMSQLSQSLPMPPAPAADWHPLVQGTQEAHRLALALVEAVRRGFLAGDDWNVRLVDITGAATHALPGYLSLLAAVDALWGGSVAPRTVTVCREGIWQTWQRAGLGYELVEPRMVEVDVEIRLETGRRPLHALGAPAEVPTIVLRDAYLPVAVAETASEPTVRVPPRLDAGEVPDALRVLLRQLFAKEDFRDGQLAALLEVLHGRDCVVLLPTGAGKSLIYQLAGLCLPGRTLVVDPLVALMEDQIRGLAEHGIDRVVGLSSALTSAGGMDAALEEVAAGDALFVFVAPERLQQASFRDALRQLSMATPVNLAVIDEAHCVSEWGHDFRTSYLNLGRVIRRVCRDTSDTPPPLLALTGTASRAVLRDVLHELDVVERSPSTLVKPRTFDRPELSFTVRRTTPAEAAATLAGVVRSLPGAFGRPQQEFFTARDDATFSGLVFTPHVNGDYGTLHVADRLARVTGQPVPTFSGSAPRGVAPAQWEHTKRDNASQFTGNRAPLLVSTKAFGMGIDKPNIRYVIHYGIPGSIESYYQEVGRAGRDRQPAQCWLVFSEFDETRARTLLDEDVDLEQARHHADGGSRLDADDVARQLFFHLNSFAGVDAECAVIEEVLDELAPLDRAHTVAIPMRNGQDRERAIHRLALLGVVTDYLVDWGGRRYQVEVRSCTADSVNRALIRYVESAQPGRVGAFAERLATSRWDKPRDAVVGCARLLTEFIYDTIERARRRSLREMWLAARECRAGEDLRRRILDYLSEGDVAPALERLVDQPTFTFGPWIDQLTTITGAADAREWRGNTARLLASYPDHPGLLLGRAASELLDPDGSLKELASALEASLTSATRRYGLDAAGTVAPIRWAWDTATRRDDHEARVVVAAVAHRLDVPGMTRLLDEELVRRSPAAAALYLPARLTGHLRAIDRVLNSEVM